MSRDFADKGQGRPCQVRLQALQPYPNVRQISWCELLAALQISNDRHRSSRVAMQYRPWKTAILRHSYYTRLHKQRRLWPVMGTEVV